MTVPAHAHWLQTASGKALDLLDPKPEQIDLDDIALGLSRAPRWAGQTKRFYSVAEHSVEVSHRLPLEHALYGMLHDATEAFLCDLPMPLKRMCPEYRKIEDRLRDAIFTRFDLPLDFIPSTFVKVENRQLATEYRDLFSHRLFTIDAEPYPETIVGFNPEGALGAFLGGLLAGRPVRLYDALTDTIRTSFATYTENKPLFGRVVGTFWRPMHARGSRTQGETQSSHKVTS